MRRASACVLIALQSYAGLVAGDRYAANQNPQVIDAPQVAANFPDVEGVTLLSPAFADPETIPSTWANATSGPTPQSTLEEYLQSLASRSDWITYHSSPDLVTEEARSLPYITLSNKKTDSKKLRVWLQGGIHGDEPAGDQGILAVLGKFANDANWTAKVLDKVDLFVLPRYNADGVAYFQRALASNYDGNRDHAVLQRQQTRDIKKLQSGFDPHIFLDAHEYTGANPIARKYVRAQDLLVSANKQPNLNKDIRALGEEFVKTIFARVEEYGIRTGPYFTTSVINDSIEAQEVLSVPQANHISAGLFQSLSFLSETRGIRLGDQHFQRRVATQYLVIETLLNNAVEKFDLVYDTIENGRKAFVESKDDIVIRDEPRTTSANFQFINATSGELVSVPVSFKNNTPSAITLIRSRPKAYVFSRVWAATAERLRLLGLNVDVLDEDFEGTVEAFNIITLKQAAAKAEGIAATTVTTNTTQRNVRIPAGGFYVDTRQKNAGYAFLLLEPESEVSQVRYNVVPVEVGDEYPIFRVV